MSVNTKLTNLANEIREISGTTTKKSLDVMASDISAANDLIDEQEGLIAQLQAAVNALPDAGGGSGSVETCTVTYDPRSPAGPGTYPIKYTDSTGKINTTNYNPMQSVEIICQKNTLIFFEGLPVKPRITAEDTTPWYNYFGGDLVIAITSNTTIET